MQWPAREALANHNVLNIGRCVLQPTNRKNIMPNIQNFDSNNNVVTFDTKNGQSALTFEAAIFKGGAARAAALDMVGQTAIKKASNGNFRASAEILMVAFPKVAKAFDSLMGESPWANKESFLSFMSACERAAPGAKGYTKKQGEARALLAALREFPALQGTKKQGAVIDA